MVLGQFEIKAFFTFGMSNTFELKTISDKDTVTGFKKVRLLDQFRVAGNYDFLKDSMNLSNLTTSARFSLAKAVSIVVNGTFSPYDWVDSTGRGVSDYAIDTRGKLGRFTSTSFNTNLTLTSKESRDKLKKNSR